MIGLMPFCPLFLLFCGGRQIPDTTEHMIKDRKEGVLYLHECALALTSAGVYLGWIEVARATGFRLVDTFNTSLYLLGIVVACLWFHQGLVAVGHRLGDMGLFESMRHARHQLFRLAAVLALIAFATKDSDVSRIFLVSYMAMMAIVLTVANVLFPKLIVRYFFARNRMRTLLVVSPSEIPNLHKMMSAREHLGITIAGWVGNGSASAEESAGLPKLGELRDLGRVMAEHEISQAVVSQHSFPPEEGRAIAQCAEEAGCRVRFFSHVQLYFTQEPVSVEQEGEYTFSTLTNEPLQNPVNVALKRLLDVAVALPVVLFVLPVLTLAVWIAQRFQSQGPVFHRQQRSGLDRKKFMIYKFRTMHVASSDDALVHQAQRNDSRVYRFGRFLRKSSLDEIPQFLNVLVGSMSVSGPRPHLLEHDEQFAKIVSTYYARHFVKPGITGLAQSRGFRGEISEPSLLRRRIGYDMLYIRRWSLFLDLQIMVDTAFQVLFPPRSAY